MRIKAIHTTTVRSFKTFASLTYRVNGTMVSKGNWGIRVNGIRVSGSQVKKRSGKWDSGEWDAPIKTSFPFKHNACSIDVIRYPLSPIHVVI